MQIEQIYSPHIAANNNTMVLYNKGEDFLWGFTINVSLPEKNNRFRHCDYSETERASEQARERGEKSRVELRFIRHKPPFPLQLRQVLKRASEAQSERGKKVKFQHSGCLVEIKLEPITPRET